MPNPQRVASGCKPSKYSGCRTGRLHPGEYAFSLRSRIECLARQDFKGCQLCVMFSVFCQPTNCHPSAPFSESSNLWPRHIKNEYVARLDEDARFSTATQLSNTRLGACCRVACGTQKLPAAVRQSACLSIRCLTL